MTSREFSVRLREDRHPAHRIREASFEAAAMAYAETWAPAGDEVAIVVRDVESGHEHCFRIDLDTGEAAPCA